ncbi:MAG: hypothetical protein K0M70_00165 [Arenimonas sp.]|uniref:hypothetical protein n=1 Tax=Arenimonas sp. TaxID=1872635 RepID=UPI0025C732AC|nr:hypothetical protein [Arenimonas sp.]MBW8366263.1 hypothetical protein [Arenimonas sp.]
MNEHESSGPDDAHSLPKRTTPTWDMELLLSGATVFALFQGAQAMLAGGAYLLPRLQDNVAMLASILLTYGFGGLILLALTFTLHLVIRAYWVALIGMNSVFPGGVRMDAFKSGPLAKDILQRRWQSMDVSIERADNAATMVFGIGVSIVLVLVPVSLGVTLMFAVVTLVGWATGLQKFYMEMLLGLMALMFLPYMLAAGIDKARGDRLVPGSRVHRLCRGTLELYARVGMSNASNPLVTVFSSNIGAQRGQAIIFAVMTTAMLASGAGMVMSRMDLGVGSYGDFPGPRRGMPSSVEGRNYASSHQRDASPVAPYIPDMVVRGSYLRLVVPYVPKWHSHLFDDCGARWPEDKTDEENQRRVALLACVGRAVQVRLNGEVVAATPEWYTEPHRDLRGLLYMVPVRDLADGRHELSVLTPPEEPPEKDEDPEQPFVIPFWR